MKKTLIVSYNFPPVGGAGVQRPVKFVKYLRDFGWEPVVLSVSNPSVPVLDHSLLEDIPQGVQVYRARTLEPGYALKTRASQGDRGLLSGALRLMKRSLSRFILPDMQILWWPGLSLKLLKILLVEKPDLVFVSAPPFSSFVPAVLVSSFFRVPVVLDYRDEWSFTRQNWENSVKTGFARRLDGILENWVLGRCGAFVAANQSYVDSIRLKYPSVSDSKGCAITNGYDQDDLGELTPVRRQGRRIRITYAGTVWRATSLQSFLQGLELVSLGAPGSCAALELDVFGRVVDEEKEYIDNSNWRPAISLHGYREHREIMKELLDSDVLLLTLSGLPGADRIITGKAFEYMAAGKHILAIVPEGETSELLRRNYQNLSLVTSGDPAEVAHALQKIINSIDDLRLREGEDVSHFSRKNLTAALCQLFDQVASKDPR